MGNNKGNSARDMARRGNFLGILNEFADFLRLVLHHFVADKGILNAASLSFTTLLALVPLMTVSIAVLAAFPIGETINQQIQDFIFNNFVPTAGEAIRVYLSEFTGKAARLTGPSFLFLVITSLMLMASIDGAFNDIWRVKRSRRPLTKFLVYWAVITAGPLFIGASVFLTSYLLSLPLMRGPDAVLDTSRLLRLMPLLASCVGFTLVYALVPMRRVPMGHALVGGVTAALLFEVAKKGFGAYLTYFPTYEAIYGALATIPIFLVWLFLSWVVTLIGAEVTFCLGARRLHEGGRRPRVQRLANQFSVLHELWLGQLNGKTLALENLALNAGVSADEVESLLWNLEKSRWVTTADDGKWLISRDLGQLRLADLYNASESALPDKVQISHLRKRGEKRLADRLASADTELQQIMDVPLKELFHHNVDE